MARSMVASSCRLGGSAPTCTTLFRSSKALTTSLITFGGILILLPSGHLALTGKVGRNIAQDLSHRRGLYFFNEPLRGRNERTDKSL